MPPVSIDGARRRGLFPALAAYGLAALAFWPAGRWLVRESLAHEQLQYSFSILGLAGVLLVWEYRRKLRLELEFGKASAGMLVGAFITLGLVYVTRMPVFVLAALTLAVGSVPIFVFGERVRKGTLVLLGAFLVYVVFVLSLPVFDWPLRTLAGKNAAWLLALFGKAVELRLVNATTGPELVLLVDNLPFVVAAECNGFGIITSSLLLSLLLVIYRRLPWLDKLLSVLAGGVIGFGLNLTRIVIIVLLAPAFPEHYWAMHEIVGTAIYWLSLAMLWWLIMGYQKRPARLEPASDQDSPAAATS